MMITGHQLKNIESSYLTYHCGNLDNCAEAPLPPEVWKPGRMVFVSTHNDFEKFISLEAPIIVCLNKVKPDQKDYKSTVFVTPHISAALATVLPLFDRKKERFYSGIHPSAVIDPTAIIEEDVSIGPLCCIGPRVKIGKGTIISSQVTIEFEAEIGQYSIIHPQVFIGAYCQVGCYCEIHPHTTIGADGFGYISGPDKKHHKIPQIGRVVIEDYVEIGANCAIDRATLAETKIGQGSKFDNLVHVAHNVRFGNNCIVTATFCIAGSSTVGNNFIAGAASKVLDHVTITDDVILGTCTGVRKNIDESGAYIGLPAEKMKNGLQTLASLSSLPKLRRQMIEVRNKMGLNNDTEN